MFKINFSNLINSFINTTYKSFSLKHLINKNKTVSLKLSYSRRQMFSNNNTMVLDKIDLPLYREYQKLVAEIESNRNNNLFEDNLNKMIKLMKSSMSLIKYKECLSWEILEEFFLTNIDKLNDKDFCIFFNCFSKANYIGKDRAIWFKSIDEVFKRNLDINMLLSILYYMYSNEEFKKDISRLEKILNKIDQYILTENSSIILLLSFLCKADVKFDHKIWRKYIPYLNKNLSFDFQKEKNLIYFFYTTAKVCLYALINGIKEFDFLIENQIKKTIFIYLKIFDINMLIDLLFNLNALGKIKNRDFIKILILASNYKEKIIPLNLSLIKVMILQFCVDDNEFSTFLKKSKVGVFIYPNDIILSEFNEEYQKYKKLNFNEKFIFFNNYAIKNQDNLISTMLDTNLKHKL